MSINAVPMTPPPATRAPGRFWPRIGQNANRARRFWSGCAECERYDHRLDTLLHGTRLRVGETIAVESSHEVRVKDLARRILTFSTSSPGELGHRVEEMLRDVEKRLLPLSNAGAVHEFVVSTAQVAR